MSSEILTAVIAAIVGTISAIVTLSIGMGQLRNEKSRIEHEMYVERKQLEQDRERLQVTLRENAEQTRVWKAEIEKLKAETEKISAEANEIKRRRLEVERQEIRDLLVLFDRAVFEAPMYGEKPVEMYKAIQQTRINLQTSGASLVRDVEIANHFQKVREILLAAEVEVQKKFTIVATIANEQNGSSSDQDKRVHEALGQNYYEPVKLIFQTRDEVKKHIEIINQRLRLLDTRIG